MADAAFQVEPGQVQNFTLKSDTGSVDLYLKGVCRNFNGANGEAQNEASC